jgi:hypothetical protein
MTEFVVIVKHAGTTIMQIHEAESPDEAVKLVGQTLTVFQFMDFPQFFVYPLTEFEEYGLEFEATKLRPFKLHD